MPRCALPLVLVVAAMGALTVGCGSTDGPPQPDQRTPTAVAPVLSATIPVGKSDDTARAMAAGEGAVWVASTGGCSGTISRIDPRRNEVVATIDTHIVYDLAVGSGAVWAVGEVCRRGPVLFRIDPQSNEIVATIPLARASTPDAGPSAVAVGRGAVWVALSSDPRTGEVVRIHPHTGEVIARIDAQGQTGEVAVGAGGVWVLSHPEYTDETDKSTALHRIDPATNEFVSTPLRDKRLLLAGLIFPRLIAVGENAVWLHSLGGPAPHRTESIRVDSRTNAVTREPLSVDRFFPFAVVDGGVWFIGPRTALSRLDPRTGEIGASSEPLRITAAADATFDPSTKSFWVDDVRGSVLRLDQP